MKAVLYAEENGKKGGRRYIESSGSNIRLWSNDTQSNIRYSWRQTAGNQQHFRSSLHPTEEGVIKWAKERRIVRIGISTTDTRLKALEIGKNIEVMFGNFVATYWCY